MALEENNNPEPGDTGLTQSQLRTLRIMVVFTTLFMVLGFIGLISVIVYRLTNPTSEEQVVSQTASQTSGASGAGQIQPLELGAKQNINSIDLHRNKIAVHITGHIKDEILVLDAATGKVLNRIQFKRR